MSLKFLIGLCWLTTLVSLSLFSGYQLISSSAPLPFSGAALFLTPIGFLFHFLDPSNAAIAELYFSVSQRSELLNLNVLIFLLPIHSLLASLLLFSRRNF